MWKICLQLQWLYYINKAFCAKLMITAKFNLQNVWITFFAQNMRHIITNKQKEEKYDFGWFPTASVLLLFALSKGRVLHLAVKRKNNA